MARIHRSFDDAPLIAARKLFPSLNDAEIINKALAQLAQTTEPASAAERHQAGVERGGKVRGAQIKSASQASAQHLSEEAETGGVQSLPPPA